MSQELKSCKRDCFPLLDLPVGVICDIFSRLPLRNILQSKLVCKMLLELLKDPYFIGIHFARAAISTTTNLIIHEYRINIGVFRLVAFDHSETVLASCSSTDRELFYYNPDKVSDSQNSIAEIVHQTKRVTLVGSCNGLLCFLVSPSEHLFQEHTFHICNPVLSEFAQSPTIYGLSPVNIYVNHSGFGYCPGTKQCKVISFMPSSGSTVMAKIHTLGSDSWRTIYEDIPQIEMAAFEPFLNGNLHWITKSREPSQLIAAFDLEKEIFRYVPLPDHFTRQYVTEVTWINIGVLRNSLCACYIYKDSEFEVWIMREYGVKESWTKEFTFELEFYCNLRVEDLHRPIKFLSNGDLLFLSSSHCLVTFSPIKRTFRELKHMGFRRSDINAHALSLLSLKDVMGAKHQEVKKQHNRKLRFNIDKIF